MILTLGELKKSIEQLGILTPVLLRPFKDRYQLVSGSRRLKAAQELGMKEAPAIIRELSDQETLEITITENLQRKDLNPIEEALGFRRLIEEFNYTHQKLAERLGKSRAYVSNSLRLLDADPLVKWYLTYANVLRKTFTAWHARTLLPLEDHVQARMADLIIDWDWTIQETRINVKKFLDGAPFISWIRQVPIEALNLNLEERIRKTMPDLHACKSQKRSESRHAGVLSETAGIAVFILKTITFFFRE